MLIIGKGDRKYDRETDLIDFATEKKRDVFPNEPTPWTAIPIKKRTSSAESHLLYKLANEGGPGNYADVGALHGGSTCTMALGLENAQGGTVYSVDYFGTGPWGSHGQNGQAAAPAIIRAYADKTFTKAKVEICIGESTEWASRLDVKFNGIFIDCDHCYDSCVKDIAAWGPKVKTGGWLAFHDVNFLGVNKAIKELDPAKWRFVRQVFTIAEFKKLA